MAAKIKVSAMVAARMKKVDPERRKEIAIRAAKARWGGIRKDAKFPTPSGAYTVIGRVHEMVAYTGPKGPGLKTEEEFKKLVGMKD